MSRIPGVNLTIFSLVYVFALFFELIFNREFLAGVIPIGMAANTQVVERVFSAMFIVGAVAYGLVLILQPIMIGIAGIYGDLPRLGKAFIWTSLYLSLILDAVHFYYGVDNTSFNPPVLFSITYVGIILITVLLLSKFSRRWIIPLLVIPDLLAYLTLLGDWLVQISGDSAFGAVTYYSGIIMPYSVMFSALSFLVFAILDGINKIALIPFTALAVVVASLVYLNAIPGLGIMIGVVFPYILGIIGVRDWMPPIIFAVAVLALGSAMLEYKKDKGVALSALSLFFGALVFDTVNTTIYLMLPVSALVFSILFSRSPNKNVNRATQDGNQLVE
jgi:hypothetical protein